MNQFHWGQIPTTYDVLENEFIGSGHSAILALMKCLAHSDDANVYRNYLIIAASYFKQISKLIYCDADGICRKPEERRYREAIFDAWVETVEETYGRLKCYGVSRKQAKYIYALICQIADLVCPMLACLNEQPFLSEFAYAIDYVVQHQGNLAKPVIPESGMFPTNYEDYHYTEGVAKELFGCLCD